MKKEDWEKGEPGWSQERQGWSNDLMPAAIANLPLQVLLNSSRR
ncbi:hypothetical protein [Oculatella sp. LEGE 06141]|nr:hypothetical protein [Oculatella sp. LEGE 06141]